MVRPVLYKNSDYASIIRDQVAHRISSLDQAKTVIMKIQINSPRSEFELDGNGHLISNRLDFTQYYFHELKRKRERL